MTYSCRTWLTANPPTVHMLRNRMRMTHSAINQGYGFLGAVSVRWVVGAGLGRRCQRIPHRPSLLRLLVVMLKFREISPKLDAISSFFNNAPANPLPASTCSMADFNTAVEDSTFFTA